MLDTLGEMALWIGPVEIPGDFHEALGFIITIHPERFFTALS